MRNKILYFLTGILSIFIGCNFVDAYVMYEGALDPHFDCVNDNTCMLVCSYHQEQEKTSADGHTYSTWNGVHIYYYYDTDEWGLSWDDGTSLIVDQHDELLGTRDEVFGKNIVFSQGGVVDNLINNGTCPNYGYSDIAGISWSSEVCFDNNGTFCKESSNAGTTFGGERVTVTKSYDVNDHIDIYFNEHYKPEIAGLNVLDLNFNNLTAAQKNALIDSCDDLSNSQLSLESTLFQDFSVNFLNNASAEFMKDWTSFSEGFEKVKSDNEAAIKKVKDYCDEQLKNEHESGNITDEELEEGLENNETGANDAIEDAEESVNEIVEDILVGGWVKINDELGSCEDYIGSVNNSTDGEPADYINMFYDIIKILITIALILLSMFDLTKAIASNTELNIVFKKIIYRLVIVLVILLLPTLIELIGELFGKSDILCGIG